MNKRMYIIAFSDSHGDTATLESIINKHKKEVNTYLFLGDGVSSIDYLKHKYEDMRIFTVKGNCDFDFSYPEFLEINLCNKKVYMSHILNKPKRASLNADIVLYGHTHIPEVKNFLKTCYICPGSTSHPRAGSNRSYAYINIGKFIIDAKIITIEDDYFV